MELQTTKIYLDIEKALQENKRYIFLRGSSRSSKSITALQHLVVTALSKPESLITIARETQVSIKNTILMDFKWVLTSLNLWEDYRYNKVEMVYKFPNNSIVRFIGLDDSTGKLRGLKSQYIMVDEVNTVSFESFVQLDIRCEKYIIAAYNPEITEDWWGLSYETKENGIMIHSSWRDNPFLDDTIIQSIKELKELDPDLYEIYSEGKIVPPREKIFVNYDKYSEEPKYKERYIGLDWGFATDPCAVVEVLINDKDVYCRELLYQAGTTNQDLQFILKELGINKETIIIADSSEPKSIMDLKRGGFNIRGVKKGQGSVLYGISKMKQHKIHIHEDSLNLYREFSELKFKKDRSGRVTNTPMGDDHGIDCVRYVITEFTDKPKTTYHFI
jgi:phage terminase large subunit